MAASSDSRLRRISEIYTPFKHQAQFHSSPAKYRLFGGAAGPGKSKALLWECIRQANRYPKVDTLLLRRTFAELDSTLIKEFRQSVPRELYKSYNESKRIVTWLNDSLTRFGYCRNESDVYQYQGTELLFVGVDELTHFTLKQWQYLTSRNRCAVPGTFPNMAGATNPGNIGHAWVKALWIDQVPPPGFDRPDLYDRSDYDFVRARLVDNPIYANDANYRKTLEALPGPLREALLDGNWDVFAGQYFDNFDRAEHTARLEEIGIQAWWPKWISIDWGFHHNFAVYWHTLGPGTLNDKGERDSFGVCYTYKEWVANALNPRELAEGIVERCNDGNVRTRIEKVFLSPDAFAHRTAEASIAEQLAQVFATYKLPAPDAADDDRIGGWQLAYQLLDYKRWKIAENCPKLIQKLPLLVRDEKHPEDIQKVDGDDEADSARYGLVSWFGKKPPLAPIGVRIAQKLEDLALKDPTMRAIQTEKMLSEEKKRNTPIPVVRGRRYGPRGRWRGGR